MELEIDYQKYKSRLILNISIMAVLVIISLSTIVLSLVSLSGGMFLLVFLIISIVSASLYSTYYVLIYELSSKAKTRLLLLEDSMEFEYKRKATSIRLKHIVTVRRTYRNSKLVGMRIEFETESIDLYILSEESLLAIDGKLKEIGYGS